jgi:hypothetical protein
MSCWKKLCKKMYNKETRYLLNYVTLHVKNKEIRQAIYEHQSNLIYRIYWPIVILSVGTFLLSVVNCYLLKIGHPFLMVTGACITFIAILFTIFKKIKRTDLGRYLLVPYFMIAGIGTSLVY